MGIGWDEVITTYQRLYTYSRYSELAKGMLEIIPAIRAESSLEDLRPGTSLATFFMELPGGKIKVMVWHEGSDKYQVYLSDSEKTWDEVIVDSTDLVVTLQVYAEKLRNAHL